MSVPPDEPARLEREISLHQQHLAATVDELAARVAPKALAQQGVESAKTKAKELVLDGDGALRVERLAAVGGAGVAVVGLFTGLAGKRRQLRKKIEKFVGLKQQLPVVDGIAHRHGHLQLPRFNAGGTNRLVNLKKLGRGFTVDLRVARRAQSSACTVHFPVHISEGSRIRRERNSVDAERATPYT